MKVDSDGVAAGFDQKFFELHGVYPSAIKDDKVLWGIIDQIPDFFISLPVIPDFYLLWDEVKAMNPVVLTGIPRNHAERSADQKREWWLKHFNHTNVITCLSREKPLHMTGPGEILIDDMVHGCKRWTKAGGNAILHRTATQTISDLRNQTFFISKKV